MSVKLLAMVCFAGFCLALTGCASVPTVVPQRETMVPPVVAPAATRVLGQASVYISADGGKLELVHDTSSGVAIVMLPDGAMAVIPEEIAGVEGRYRDKQLTLWENDGSVLLWNKGELVFNGMQEN